MPIIFQINVTANWGSTGKIAESIGNAAMRAGWDSYLAYGRWNNPSTSKLVKIGGPFNKYLHFAEQRVFDNEGLCSRRATRKLINTIDTIKPDIVQLHNIHDHYLNYRLLFGYLRHTNIKVVWTFHDCWAFTGHCFHFITKDCMKWRSGCFNCPMKNAQPSSIFDRSQKNYELKKSLFGDYKNLIVVPVSEWMATFVRESFLRNHRIEVINNGIDLNTFKPLYTEKNNNRAFNVLAVSNVWDDKKGFKDIFKVREILSEDYNITIVGLSETQLRQLPSGITGIKRTQNVQELVKLYSNANVFINLTYADTFPTVNLESLACGTPVITYKTGGSPETIDADTGIVVEQGDWNGIATAIQEIRAKKITLDSNKCRNRAERLYNKDICFDKYIKLYMDLICK